MVRDGSPIVDAHTALHVIGDVLHDPDVKKDEMIKLADDCYFANFAGKRDKEELYVFVGTLIGILCGNLEVIVQGEQPNGPAN